MSMLRLLALTLVLASLSTACELTQVTRTHNDPADDGTPGPDPIEEDEFAPRDKISDIVAGAATKVVTLPAGTSAPFTEGPLRLPDNSIIFSEFRSNRIYRWAEAGGLSTFLENAGTNGLTLDPQNRIVACRQGNRSVERISSTGMAEVIVDDFGGDRFNKPNDCVVRRNGDIFFTDPDYGLPAADKDLAFNGVFRVPAGQNVAERVAADVTFGKPNGITFAPAEDVIYIGDNPGNRIHRFPVLANGQLGPGELFVNVASPDGIKVDRHGHLYVTSSEGIVIFHPNKTRLGVVPVPEIPANCAFGGADLKTLFVTARTSLYRIPLKVPGVKPGTP